jgi:hypothetical protein
METMEVSVENGIDTLFRLLLALMDGRIPFLTVGPYGWTRVPDAIDVHFTVRL